MNIVTKIIKYQVDEQIPSDISVCHRRLAYWSKWKPRRKFFIILKSLIIMITSSSIICLRTKHTHETYMTLGNFGHKLRIFRSESLLGKTEPPWINSLSSRSWTQMRSAFLGVRLYPALSMLLSSAEESAMCFCFQVRAKLCWYYL